MPKANQLFRNARRRTEAPGITVGAVLIERFPESICSHYISSLLGPSNPASSRALVGTTRKKHIQRFWVSFDLSVYFTLIYLEITSKSPQSAGTSTQKYRRYCMRSPLRISVARHSRRGPNSSHGYRARYKYWLNVPRDCVHLVALWGVTE